MRVFNLKVISVIVFIFISIGNKAIALDDLLIRIDDFYGGPLHKSGEPYTLSGRVVYMGTETFQSVYLNWQIGDGNANQIFFDEININPYIPFVYDLENKWIPELEGNYLIKIWFTGLNGEDPSVLASTIFEKLVEVKQGLPTRDLVLLESFSSIHCGSCALATPILLNLIAQNPSGIRQVYYHPLRNENSPLYSFSPKDHDLRRDYYEIFYTPLSVIGGTYHGGSESVEMFHLGKEQQKWAGFELDGTWYVHEGLLNWTLNGVSYADVANADKDYRLYVVAVQDSLNFEEPPGTNGEKDFYNVMRFFSPDANGFRLNADQHRNEFTIEQSMSWSEALDTNRVDLLAFVQDINSREIYQVSELSYMMPDFTNTDELPVAEKIQVFPNPASGGSLTISNIPSGADHVEFLNVGGQQVKRVKVLHAVQSVDVSDLETGIYFVRLLGASLMTPPLKVTVVNPD